jgi:hypothetical protein
MTTIGLDQQTTRVTPARGLIAPSLLKAAEQGRSTAVRTCEDWTASLAPAARYLKDPGAGPDSHVLGRWRQGPDGGLICTWELKGPPSARERPAAAKPAESTAVDRSRGARNGEQDLWRWLVVAGLAAGYVFTGVAYFMG